MFCTGTSFFPPCKNETSTPAPCSPAFLDRVNRGCAPFSRVRLPYGMWRCIGLILLALLRRGGCTSFSGAASDGKAPQALVDAVDDWENSGGGGSIEEWDVSHVTSLRDLFRDRGAFNADLSKWDTSRVTSMHSVFRKARSFNGDVSTWDTSRVTEMSGMFFSANEFNSDISRWDVGQLRRADNMFQAAREFKRGTFCSESWFLSPVGNSLFEGRSQIFCCRPGYFLNTTISTALVDADCRMCDIGKFKSEYSLNNSCTPAARDTFVPAPGLTRETACPENMFSNPPDSELCSLCPAGWRTSRGPTSTECVECASGRFQELQGNESCVECPAGYRSKDTSASLFCTSCPPGFYQTSTGAGECNICSQGTFQDLPGSTSASCKPCAVGRYQDQVGSSACKACERGKWGSADLGATSATSCKNCSAGRYSSATALYDSLQCLPVPAGKYSEGEGMSNAIAKSCPAGWVSLDSGQSSCSKCEQGFYQEGGGEAVCLPCTPGEYQDQRGQRSCKQCSTNTYSAIKQRVLPCDPCARGRTSEAGSTVCSDCAPGKRQVCEKLATDNIACSNPSDEVCESCESGKYSSDINMRKCKVCPQGFSSGEGSHSCTKCDEGQYGSAPGVCSKCVPGMFQDGKGERSCKDCPADTFSEKTGAASNSDCLKCASEYEPHTTTGGKVGVWNSTASCVCAGEDLQADIGTDARKGYYTSDNASETKGLCLPCLEGASCRDHDTKVTSMTALPGHWRPTPSALHFPSCATAYSGKQNADVLAKDRCCTADTCRNLTFTTEDPSLQCSPGYSGVICAACASNYVKMGTDCVHCEGGSSIAIAFLSIFVVCVLAFFVLMAVFLCGVSAQGGTQKTSAFFGQVKILIT